MSIPLFDPIMLHTMHTGRAGGTETPSPTIHRLTRSRRRAGCIDDTSYGTVCIPPLRGRGVVPRKAHNLETLVQFQSPQHDAKDRPLAVFRYFTQARRKGTRLRPSETGSSDGGSLSTESEFLEHPLVEIDDPFRFPLSEHEVAARMGDLVSDPVRLPRLIQSLEITTHRLL